jgi:hypothetical protein
VSRQVAEQQTRVDEVEGARFEVLARDVVFTDFEVRLGAGADETRVEVGDDDAAGPAEPPAKPGSDGAVAGPNLVAGWGGGNPLVLVFG